MLNFLQTYSPQPIIFSLGPFNIYWYGLLIVVGILLGLWLVVKLAKNYQLKTDDILELVLYLIIFGLLGGRLYHIFLEVNYYWASPLAIFKVWQGGLAIHGVLIAGIITLIIWAKKKKQSFWQWADLLAPAIILGQAIGRWGNYFNQELFGRPTNLPWGIPIGDDFFHPTFFYESIADFFIFLILIFVIIKIKPQAGKVFLLYLILYSVARFITEFWRVDQTPAIGWLRWPQVVSLLVLCLAAIFWSALDRKQIK